jgi:hypothetical protein
VYLTVKISHAESPRFPQQCQSAEGKSDLSPMLFASDDVQAVNIRLPYVVRYHFICDEVCEA